MQTASALGAAHAKGDPSTRDLKPDNLFVVPDEANPGSRSTSRFSRLRHLPRLQTTAPRRFSFKTRTGALMGTPIVHVARAVAWAPRKSTRAATSIRWEPSSYELTTRPSPFSSEGFGALLNMHLNQPPPSAARDRARDFARSGIGDAQDAGQKAGGSLPVHGRGRVRARRCLWPRAPALRAVRSR